MFSVIAGAVTLFLIVVIVKEYESRNVQPTFIAYLIVILAGFYGAVGFANFFFPMLANSPIEAMLNGVCYLSGLLVMLWGLSIFKHLQMES
jgi:hypothetical protein